jgi:hypothetical protein
VRGDVQLAPAIHDQERRSNGGCRRSDLNSEGGHYKMPKGCEAGCSKQLPRQPWNALNYLLVRAEGG